jgi:hypothetical protein
MGAPEHETTANYSQLHPQTYAHSDQTQTFRLSPHIEEEIRAAVKGSTSAQALNSTKWIIYKKALRLLSLFTCGAMLITEIVIASQNTSQIDTGFCITLVGTATSCP